LLVVAVAVFVAWANDAMTLQAERTVYTVACQGGGWEGERCTGKLVASDRYRFRALKAHSEVLFWVAGSSAEPSGRLSPCEIKDGRNWSCKPSAEAARTITLKMVRGRAVPDPSANTRPFHAISKWRWLLLRYT
jgi:hypothetical protein